MPFGATPRLPTPGIDGNCYGNPWPYGDHILTGMFPESYGGLGMLGYNWQEYWPADHEVMAGWADELESEDIAKIGAATALLHDNRELIEGLESLAGLLGSGTLASLADTFKNAASRVRGDYPQTASTLDPGDVDSTFGYMGATIIARRSTDNPLYKMLWHEDADATMSEIRKFVGKPDEPAAFTYPLNWTYAGNHGLSEPVAETDTTAAWDGFALPDDLKKKLSKIGGTVNVDGWWAETGLTAGIWAGGALLGHPTFYTFGAFFYSQWDDLGDALTEASTAEFANDSAASVFRGIARFWDTSGNPVATIVSAVLAIVEAIFTALHFLCLYPAFCWLDTAAKRARIDAVIGPLRTDASVELEGTAELLDPSVVDAGVFPDRYFVAGLLFRLFTGAGGICATWECFTCEERASVRQFFIDQKVHCACESDEEDDESDDSSTAGDSKATGAAVRNLDLQWFLNQVATAKGVQQPNGADVGGVQPIKS